MKFLRNTLDKLKPNFEKGKKLHFLHSVFDGIETFMFVPKNTTKRGVHIRDGIDLKRTMFVVVIALVPALLFGMWNVGFQHFNAIGETPEFWNNMLYGALKVLPIVIVSYGVGLGIEFAFCQYKGHPINEGYLVTGILIPLTLPPDIPLWMVAVGAAFAVIIGKEVFGGSGMNILNPALTARVFLYFAYPGAMSGDTVWTVTKGGETVDGFSGATNLGELAAGNNLSASTLDNFIGWIPGSIGETSVLMILLGAAVLVITGIGSWRVMLGVFAGGLGMGALVNMMGTGSAWTDLPAYEHLLIGGFAFGAVFMATDPVTAAQTTIGMWIYGILIGVITVLIRVFNPVYPEGIMMAILFMNVFAPLIDYYVVQANVKRRLSRVKVQQG